VEDALVAAAESVVRARFGERFGLVWPVLEPEVRQAASELAAAAVLPPAPAAELTREEKKRRSIERATKIAAGTLVVDPEEREGGSVRAAYNNNVEGRKREHWYRLVWRDGAWSYYAEGRLPPDRRASVFGDVWEGELVAQHDRGGGVNAVYLARWGSGEVNGPMFLVDLDFRRVKGELLIALPDGSQIKRPDPRR